MQKLIMAMLLTGAAGCLTVTESEVSRWPVEFAGEQSVAKSKAPIYDHVRLMHVAVRCPYDDASIAVLRADGTFASDPYNEFAAAPASLLKGVVFDAFMASGRFSQVVPTSSLISTKNSAEVLFSRLVLDCREAGTRRAVCEVSIRLLKDRDLDKLLVGEGEADAADGNYGKAFSKAVSMAVSSALAKLD